MSGLSRMRRRNFHSAIALLLGQSLLNNSFGKAPNVRRIVCPFAPGGIADTLSRVIAQEASKIVGEHWYVENKPGAGGLIGATEVALSVPNGTTMLYSPAGVIRTHKDGANGGGRFDPVRDLEASVIFGEMPFVCVTQSLRHNLNLKLYFKHLYSSSSSFVYATSGHGSTGHLMGAYMAKRAQLTFVHVPYGGAAPTINAVLGGHVPCAIVDPMLAAPHIENGNLHCMAISSNVRSERMANIETLYEQGLSDITFTSWQGLLAPARIPWDIKKAIIDILMSASASRRLKEVLSEGFVAGTAIYGIEANNYMLQDRQLYQRLITDLDIKLT
jgi:tripartite-type tricarboxylate transporter receptor subunit TctC